MSYFQTARVAAVAQRELGVIQIARYMASSIFARGSLRQLTIRGHNVVVRSGTHDLSVAISTLGREFETIADLLPPDFDGVLVDAGGFIGTAALKLHGMFPKATVVVVEPSHRNLEILKQNLAGLERIEIVEAALWTESDQQLNLSDRGTGEWGFTVLPRDGCALGYKKIHTVRTTSMAEIADRHAGREIGFLKLDVEGAERALFEDDADQLRAIPAILVELHDRFAPGCSDAFRAFSKQRWVIKTDGEKYLSLAFRRS